MTSDRVEKQYTSAQDHPDAVCTTLGGGGGGGGG